MSHTVLYALIQQANYFLRAFLRGDRRGDLCRGGRRGAALFSRAGVTGRAGGPSSLSSLE